MYRKLEHQTHKAILFEVDTNLPKHYWMAFKNTIMTLNNVTLKLDADFTLKFGSMTDVYLKHL
jgi:hypothetical protein